jgi:hypothetical protein
LSKKFYFTDLIQQKNTCMIKPTLDINIPEHINKEELRQKISELFSYRMFPWLLSESDKTEEENGLFMERLFELQESIYLLDAMLESRWEINDQDKERHWQHIIDQTKPCLTKDLHPLSVLQHIKKYEKHEIAIRSGHWPVRLSMSYFYFYKSCDVKLLRRLIYDFAGLEKKLGNLASWRLFDFVTEVNDDITDVFEDLSFYNGNRFLIHLLLYGKKSTEDVFLQFLKKLDSDIENKRKLIFKSEAFEIILENSSIQTKETITLLKDRIDQVDITQLTQESVLTPYLLRNSKTK